jgi:hypothetical protein
MNFILTVFVFKEDSRRLCKDFAFNWHKNMNYKHSYNVYVEKELGIKISDLHR